MSVKLWKDKKNGEIDPGLLDTTAKEFAKKINLERINSRDKVNKSTQIRKFFDEVIRFQGLLQTNPEQFNELLPYIKMLNAKAAYAAGRDLIGSDFKSFLSEGIGQVNDRKDFELFCSFFEAFLGFYKYYSEKEKNGSAQGQYQGGNQQRREYIPSKNR
jgi:CRISPR-associated protein Csm2